MKTLYLRKSRKVSAKWLFVLALALLTGQAGCGFGKSADAAPEPPPSQKPAANLPPSRAIVWHLGRQLSLAAVSYDAGEAQAKVDSLLKNARTLAEVVGAEIPDLPKKTGDKSQDSAAILHYVLREAKDPLAAKVLSKYGEDHAALVELSMKTNLLLMLYYPGDKLTMTLAEVIKRNGPRAGLPAHLWQPLLDKIDRKASSGEIVDAVLKMYADVGLYLESAK